MGSVDIPFATHSHRERERRAFSGDDDGARSKNSTTALLYDEEGNAKREIYREKRNGRYCRYALLALRKKIVSAR